jgi:superfamily II DNA/RNA helicase
MGEKVRTQELLSCPLPLLLLSLQGVGAVSVHGGKSQEERNEAIREFKAGTKDVLVATDGG